ncbi:MAG: histidine phosphatase family protein [Thiobacillus sp.]
MIQSSARFLPMAASLAMLILAISQPALANEVAWQALKNGGQVVLMRHTAVEPGKGNPRLLDATCTQERNLSQQGKADADRVGKAFETRAIPLGEVMSSPYCRTQDTARHAFGHATSAEFLSLSEALTPAEAARNTAEAMKRIGEYDGAANLVMVTHEPNIASISFELVEQGTFLVLKPRGGSEFDVIGKVRLEDLAD